jgi:hypothetical protein
MAGRLERWSEQATSTLAPPTLPQAPVAATRTGGWSLLGVMSD